MVQNGPGDPRRLVHLLWDLVNPDYHGRPLYKPVDPFMQDNARIHKFGGTPEWLMNHEI